MTNEPLSFAHHEGHLGLADNFAVDLALAFGFADLAPQLGQYDIDHQRVAWMDGPAPFYILSRHEVRELPRILNLLQHQDAGDLRDRFELQHSRHNRMAREVPLKVSFVHGDVFHADDVVALDLSDAIDHEKRWTMRQDFHDA